LARADEAVAIACRAKARTVAADETEQGVRALLNLGHTFGHALEAAAGYSDRLLHGEAVSIGMVLAHDFRRNSAWHPPEDATPRGGARSLKLGCRRGSAKLRVRRWERKS